MLAPSAAYGYRQIATIITHKARQPARDKAAYVFSHSIYFLLAFKKIDHCHITSSQRAQIGIIVRVGQAAHIEYQIRIQRDAMLEAERGLSLIHISEPT